jgi:glycogen(starch) synthase
MRVCIVSAEHSGYGGIGHATRRQASVLATRHDVTFVSTSELPGGGASKGVNFRVESAAQPDPRHARLAFASQDHMRSAAVLAAIERAYPDAAPDYLEFCDYRALGLVPLQARAAGHQLLRRSVVALRLSSSAELLALHDGRSTGPGERRVAELEREQFRLADFILDPGGDVVDVYRRYYRPLTLPPAVKVTRPFPPPPSAPVLCPRDPEAPLRILYAGRLQRLKGVLELVEACLRLPRDDWELTMIGADTPTAPLGLSMKDTIEILSGGDPRIRIEDPLPHDELQRRWAEHDLLVVPSTYEVWPNVALEAMRAGLPVLATPVGGLVEIVQPAVNGWLTDGLGTGALAAALALLLEDRGALERVRQSGSVHETFRRLTDPEPVLTGYERLLQGGRPQPVAGGGQAAEKPLVTAVVPYYRSHEYVEETVDSLLGQTHPRVEVVIVNDGSFEPEDAILDKLTADPRVRVVTSTNRGDGPARNLGIALAREEYLLMFDADNVLEPEFVARALAILQSEPELAYVTCWLRFIGPDGRPLADGGGYAPLGNRVLSQEEENWDGDTTALVRRSALAELAPPHDPRTPIHGDWNLYRRLRDRGLYGAVIPELLARYRVHPDSMLRTTGGLHERGWQESCDWRRLERTQWTGSR